MIDEICVIGSSLIVDAPPPVDEFKAAVLNEISYSFSNSFILHSPPLGKVDYFSVDKSLQYNDNGKIMKNKFDQDSSYLLSIFIDCKLMDDTVNNLSDADVVDVVPQSVKVLIHSFLVTGIIVGVYIL